MECNIRADYPTVFSSGMVSLGVVPEVLGPTMHLECIQRKAVKQVKVL